MKPAQPAAVRCIAHRLGALLGPENTLAAAKAALRAGARALECDVKLSADGVAFLMHDDSLQRTTGTEGRAAIRPWRELAGLRAGLVPGGDTPARIPSLEQLARLLHGRDVWLNLEIKPDANAPAALQWAWGRDIAACAAALWADAAQPPVLSSFSIPALQGAAERAPHLPRAWLCETLPRHWRGVAQTLGLQALHLGAGGGLDPAHAAALHAAGLHLRIYTVDSVAAARALLRLGADAVFSDVVFSDAQLETADDPPA